MPLRKMTMALPAYLLSDVRDRIMREKPRGLNIYTCEVCKKHIVTLDREPGVTPFMTPCQCTPNCRGMMVSSMYRVFDQSMKPDFEWYRPTDAEYVTMKPHTKEHLQKGGLILSERLK